MPLGARRRRRGRTGARRSRGWRVADSLSYRPGVSVRMPTAGADGVGIGTDIEAVDRGACPRSGSMRAVSIRTVVVLPAPFGPEQAEDLAAADVEVDAADGPAVAERPPEPDGAQREVRSTGRMRPRPKSRVSTAGGALAYRRMPRPRGVGRRRYPRACDRIAPRRPRARRGARGLLPVHRGHPRQPRVRPGTDRTRGVDRRGRLHARGAGVGTHRRRPPGEGADAAGVCDRRRRRGRRPARPWPQIVIALLFMAYWIFESAWQPLGDALTVNIVDRQAVRSRPAADEPLVRGLIDRRRVPVRRCGLRRRLHPCGRGRPHDRGRSEPGPRRRAG